MVSKGNHPQMALTQVSENIIIYPDRLWLLHGDFPRCQVGLAGKSHRFISDTKQFRDDGLLKTWRPGPCPDALGSLKFWFAERFYQGYGFSNRRRNYSVLPGTERGALWPVVALLSWRNCSAHWPFHKPCWHPVRVPLKVHVIPLMSQGPRKLTVYHAESASHWYCISWCFSMCEMFKSWTIRQPYRGDHHTL